MKKETIILTLGIIVAAVPFLGFPGRFETTVSVLAGAGVIVFILLLQREIAQKPFSLKKHFEKRADSFVQNNGGHQRNLPKADIQ